MAIIEKMATATINGTLLILLIIFIRQLFYNKLSKKLLLVLWELAFICLLIPVKITLPTTMNTGRVGVVQTALNAPIHQIAVAYRPATITVHQNRISLQEVWLIIYLLGLFFFVVFLLRSYFKSNQIIQEALPVSNKFIQRWTKTMNQRIQRSIQVYVSDRVYSPFTCGIFKPKIIIPSDFQYSEEQILRLVLTHEWMHIKRWDCLRKRLLLIILILNWFNPVIWGMYYLYNQDIEILCDELSLKHLGLGWKKEYAQTLLQWNTQTKTVPFFQQNFSKHALKGRIIAIMKINKSKKIVYSSFALLAITVGFTVLITQQTQASSQIKDKVTNLGGAKLTKVDAKESQEKIPEKNELTLDSIALSAVKPIKIAHGKAVTKKQLMSYAWAPLTPSLEDPEKLELAVIAPFDVPEIIIHRFTSDQLVLSYVNLETGEEVTESEKVFYDEDGQAIKKFKESDLFTYKLSGAIYEYQVHFSSGKVSEPNYMELSWNNDTLLMFPHDDYDHKKERQLVYQPVEIISSEK